MNGPVLDHSALPAVLDCALTFYRLLDERNYSAMAGLMHPAGVWRRMGEDVTGANLVEKLTRRPPTLLVNHLLVGLCARELTSREASLCGYMLLARHDSGQPYSLPVPFPGLALIEDWHAKLGLTDAGWKILRIDGQVTFSAAG